MDLLHIISDGLIALAFTSIPLSLVYLFRKRKGVPFRWMWLWFGLVIVTCGVTHLLQVGRVWGVSYAALGIAKSVTAIASVTTAIVLYRVLPRAVAMPTAAQYDEANAQLRLAHAALEQRVAERTAELTRRNDELARESAERKRSEERLRRLADSGIVGLLVGHVERNVILEANDAALSMLGYSRAELEAGELTGEKLNFPEFDSVQEKARREFAASGVARPWEKDFRRKDGTRVPVLTAVTSIEPPHFLSVILDLTAQKRAEETLRRLHELREQDATIRALLEAAPDAMVIANQSGDIVLINAQAEKLFGYPREELIGKSVDVLLPDRLRPGHSTKRARYFADASVRAAASGLDLSARKKDGTEFPAEISLSPLETKDGLLVSSAIRDITERKRAERELRRAKDGAETAIGELEAFSYSVAHDLRAPLRAINGFSVALTEDYADRLDSAGRGYLTRISNGANRMGQLIDALLALSRVSRTEPAFVAVDLSQIGQSVVAQLMATDPDRNVEFVVQSDLTARGDPALLRAVLENLLGNSWKFGSKTPNLTVELGKAVVEDGATAFFVRDNGAGFEMEYSGKLFTAFQRLHGTSEFPGTGIGLATVERIIRRHGGRVWAEGAVNRGATFYFTLQDPRGVVT